jgi:hypothetical protein
MDLQTYIREYSTKSRYRLTERQQEYIIALTESEDPLRVVSEVLNQPITSWDELSRDHVTTVIHGLLARKPCHKLQLRFLQAMFPSLDDVAIRLRRPIKTWEELSIRDYKFLMKSPDRFHLVPKDHPLDIQSAYEFGWQESDYCHDGKMYYLKFYEFMMMDFDSITRDNLVDRLSKYPEMVFRLYQTHNGFHVFVMSQPFPHFHQTSYEFMTSLGCDHFYILFAYKFGYKIRLSPKKDRDEQFLASYLETIGDPKMIDPTCNKLIEIHDDYVQRFTKNSVSLGDDQVTSQESESIKN